MTGVMTFYNKNKKLKTLKNTRLSASLKAGDERIESLRTLKIPCNYAGLRDLQLAFTGSEMAISGSWSSSKYREPQITLALPIGFRRRINHCLRFITTKGKPCITSFFQEFLLHIRYFNHNTSPDTYYTAAHNLPSYL